MTSLSLQQQQQLFCMDHRTVSGVAPAADTSNAASANHHTNNNTSNNDCGWLDSTNRSVVLTSEHSSSCDWNHCFALGEEPASMKRVSLDVTETWMTDEDGCSFEFMNGLDSDPVLLSRDTMMDDHDPPGHISFLPDDPWSTPEGLGDDDLLMEDVSSPSADAALQRSSSSSGDGVDDAGGMEDASASKTFSQQFQERREQLALSMRASKVSRQCLFLKEHASVRANLEQVLVDIEKSTKAIQRHCLEESMSMDTTVVDEITKSSLEETSLLPNDNEKGKPATTVTAAANILKTTSTSTKMTTCVFPEAAQTQAQAA